jgi:hypothetical protein
MAIFERRPRFGGDETWNRGLLKKRQHAGFLAKFPEFDNENGRMETHSHCQGVEHRGMITHKACTNTLCVGQWEIPAEPA